MARTGIRASAIIIKNKKILLMHRKKEGREYWVFPGGGIEDSETPEEAVIREVQEETGLTATNPKLAFMDFNVNVEHPVYFVEVNGGNPKLGGPEAEHNSADNWYHPEWIELNEIEDLTIFSESAKQKLLEII